MRRPKPVALIPPEVEARAELAALAEAGEDGAIVSRVGQVLRRYFSKAYGLPGEEATTAEFLAQLEKHTAG